jgi:hypothetical protein
MKIILNALAQGFFATFCIMASWGGEGDPTLGMNQPIVISTMSLGGLMSFLKGDVCGLRKKGSRLLPGLSAKSSLI